MYSHSLAESVSFISGIVPVAIMSTSVQGKVHRHSPWKRLSIWGGHCEKLPVILAREVQRMEIGSVPLSRFGDLEAVGGLCAGNEDDAVAGAVTAHCFSLWPHSRPPTPLK